MGRVPGVPGFPDEEDVAGFAGTEHGVGGDQHVVIRDLNPLRPRARRHGSEGVVGEGGEGPGQLVTEGVVGHERVSQSHEDDPGPRA